MFNPVNKDLRFSKRHKLETWFDEESCLLMQTFYGSPSDCRKYMKLLEWSGWYPLHAKRPIMREGRTYSVTCTAFYVENHLTYTIGREK